MDQDRQELLVKLKVIASLDHQERLCTTRSDIETLPNTFLSGIYRWWLGENRTQNLHVVGRILSTAFTEINAFIAYSRTSSCDMNSPKYITDQRFITRLEQEIRSARKGLDLLRITYQTAGHATTTTARIEAMIDSIDAHLTELSQYTQYTVADMTI